MQHHLTLDWKCAITTAILTVLIYILMTSVLSKSLGEDTGKTMTEANWFKSMEMLMLVSAFIAYLLNAYIFTSCKP